MANIFTHVPYPETGYFSKLVTDYLSHTADIKPFYVYEPNSAGLAKAIADRANYPVDRKALVDALNKQYTDLPRYEKAEQNIQLLLQENTFTVCTAHQPNLLTGYLYFIYKILHAIKLAESLAAQHPDKHFVPVYYMGSEDNDLEELGTFKFRGEKYVWDGGGQKGAVGRMNTASLKPLLNDLFKTFGPPGKKMDELQTLITTAYLKHKTIGAATQYLVNELFGRYGLIVLDPDEASLKQSFIPVMEDELLHQSSLPVLHEQIEKLGRQYKIQAMPREINLFYLNDNLRERIEKKEDKWIAVNTDITWTKDEIINELHEHPERFSPNVMLRGLYQETILPDVAFIGGGAEVAYWLQLQTLFAHYKGFFPVVYLRQSVMWIGEQPAKLRGQLELTIPELFRQEPVLAKEYVEKHSSTDWHTEQERAAMEQIIRSLKEKANRVDTTLAPAAEAGLTRIKYQMETLEKKMLRAEKRKMEVQLQKITRMKAGLFPKNGLQERVENFSEYYLAYGSSFFDTLLEGMDAGKNEFLVVEVK